MGTFVVAPLELRIWGVIISRCFCSLVVEGGAWTAVVVADESSDAGACMGEDMDEDIDVYATKLVCMGAGIVSGTGTSSNETLVLSPLSLDEVMGSKSCGGRGSAQLN